jgi:hypothetical protein
MIIGACIFAWLMFCLWKIYISAHKAQHPAMFVLRRQVQDALHEIKQFDKGAQS